MNLERAVLLSDKNLESGISNGVALLQRLGKPPENVTNTTGNVTNTTGNVTNTSENVTKSRENVTKSRENVTKTDKRRDYVLEILKSDCAVTTEEIAEKLNVSKRTFVFP